MRRSGLNRLVGDLFDIFKDQWRQSRLVDRGCQRQGAACGFVYVAGDLADFAAFSRHILASYYVFYRLNNVLSSQQSHGFLLRCIVSWILPQKQ